MKGDPLIAPSPPATTMKPEGKRLSYNLLANINFRDQKKKKKH